MAAGGKKDKSASSRQAAVRCLACFARFVPPPASARARCPACGLWWRLAWVGDDFAKIRGPVWESFPGLEDVDI